MEALEQVQPTDLNASEISVRLGSTWLPPDVVAPPPIREAIKPKSTHARSASDTARASEDVSTLVITVFCLMVRLVNISAGRT